MRILKKRGHASPADDADRRPPSLIWVAVIMAASCTGTMARAAATGDDGIRVAMYFGDKRAAVTMTFDDTLQSHLTQVKPLFDEFGYRCTFYINSERIGPDKPTDWPAWRAAAHEGYEVGNHTTGHYLKGDKPSPEHDAWNTHQIHGGYEAIKEKTGIAPLTFAFPGGGQNAYTLGILKATPHIDYRRAPREGNRYYPEGDTLTAARGIAEIDKVIAHTKAWHGGEVSWLLFYMHKISEERAAVLRAMLEHIKKHDAEVWCDSYARVTLYEREREASALTIVENKPKRVVFTLINDLDPAIFNVPLTIIIPIQSPVADTTVERGDGGSEPNIEVRDDRILVHVIPGRGNITVTWR